MKTQDIHPNSTTSAQHHNAPAIVHIRKPHRSRLIILPLALVAAVMLNDTTPAFAGTLHAQSQIAVLGKIKSRCAPEYGAADSMVDGRILWLGKYRYRVSHEELYSNYTYGNDGTGHAHHHNGTCSSFPGAIDFDPPPPELGSPGTSQFLSQTWTPNNAGDQITVTLSPGGFVQVDLSDLTPGHTLVSGGSLKGKDGLFGSFELLAWMDDAYRPQIGTEFTGIFEGVPFNLVSYDNGVVSLQFSSPVSFTVPGQASTFDIAIEGTIDGVDFPTPEPGTLALVGSGVLGLGGMLRRRLRG